MFSALAFTVLMRTGIYPPELRSTNLDADWLYRRLLPSILSRVEGWSGNVRLLWIKRVQNGIRRFVSQLYRHHGPEGILARTWPTGSMAFWATLLLGTYLILYYL
jgi:multicomponent Na+:H+ antiporter subunit D